LEQYAPEAYESSRNCLPRRGFSIAWSIAIATTQELEARVLTRSIAAGVTLITLTLGPLSRPAAAQGKVVVRVDDSSGSHCIDATAERITVFVRRVFVERRNGLFTQDNKAGVLVRTKLQARTTDENHGDASVQVPSVDLVSVKDDAFGRVSLALEYAVASDFELRQGDNLTTVMDVYLDLAKARGRNGFGDVLDLAGAALQQVTLPGNLFAQIGSKFLKFANEAVDTTIKAGTTEEIAHVSSSFKRGNEPNLDRCKAQGYERTGVIAALLSTGAAGQPLVPTTNTERDYCFRYSSDNTYELLAARRGAEGSCPAAPAFSAVMNDYVMLLLSAESSGKAGKGAPPPLGIEPVRSESARRCAELGLDKSACGAR
jgi:hypothetical protein